MLVTRVVLTSNQLDVYGKYSDEPEKLLESRNVATFDTAESWQEFVIDKVGEALYDSYLCRIGGNSK